MDRAQGDRLVPQKDDFVGLHRMTSQSRKDSRRNPSREGGRMPPEKVNPGTREVYFPAEKPMNGETDRPFLSE